MRRLRSLLLAVLILGIVVIPAGASTDIIQTNADFTQNGEGIVWINTQVGYLIYARTSGTPDLVWTKTVDGGTTWTTPVTIQATCTPGVLSVWFDQWTKGNAGTRIHIAWHRDTNSGNICGNHININYTYLDTANDVLGLITTSTVTAYTGSCTVCAFSLTKAVDGTLYIYANLTTSANQRRLLISTNGGSTWSTGSTGVSGGEIRGHISPAVVDASSPGIATSDLFGFDASLKQALVYRKATNAWLVLKDFSSDISGTVCALKFCTNRAVSNTFGISSAWFGMETDITLGNPHTLYVVRITRSAIAQLVANPFTATTNIQNSDISYDANSGLLYAWWLDPVIDQVFYRTSNDEGFSWSTTTRFDDSVNAKQRVASVPIISRSGGWIMPIWEESADLVTNLSNATVTSSEVVPDDQDAENKLQRFATGLGFTGEGGRFAFAAIGGLLLSTMLVFRAPVIVFLSLEMIWFGLMATPNVEFISAGAFITLLAIFGILMIFAVLQKLVGDQTGGLE